MEIIASTEPIFVADYEVKCLLEERKQQNQSHLSQDAQTVEYEALTYLNSISRVSEIKNSKVFEELMTYLGSLRLTKFERLQVANALPRNVIDFYVLVEECEERFDTQVIEEEILPTILKIISNDK